MKRIFSSFIVLLGMLSVAYAQNPKDTTNVKAQLDTLDYYELGDMAEAIDTLASQDPGTPIDTLDTKDKFVKIVLYENHTWAYIDMGRPVIDETSIYKGGWDTNSIHAFKAYPKDSIPAEVDLLLVDQNNPFFLPIQGKINSKYGPRRGRNHNGCDVDLEIGDTIRVPFNGVVRHVDTDRKASGYGCMVVIRHSNGLETYYGHLSKVLVHPNEIVKAGEILGLGGNTGRSTGPHLHFEARYKGYPFDPLRIIDFTNGQLRDTMFTLKKHYLSIYSHYGQTDQESYSASQALYVKIKNGDTLGKLAKKYGTTVNALCKMNGIKSTTLLRVGRSIRVR